jgi:radical SAM superfamily enzyme YgiQ (UPF0313 family)
MKGIPDDTIMSTDTSILLIYSPVAKPCEPPPGLATLAGTLKQHGVRFRAVDGNIAGLLDLIHRPLAAADTWTSRALRHFPAQLDALNDPVTYRNEARYRQAVLELNRIAAMSARASGVDLTLTNYRQRGLSPLRSADLIKAAEIPEQNPFFSWFSVMIDTLTAEEEPSIIGFSLNYLSQALCTFAMIGYVRRHIPSARILLGGGLTTSWIRRPHWHNPFNGLVDECIDGPGERRLLELSGKVPQDGRRAPDYDNFRLYRYLSPGFVLPYSASTGCYWNRCSFCPEQAEGTPYSPRRTGQVIADIEHLVRTSGPALLHILDNAISPAVLSALIDNPPGVPWYGFVRISHHLADFDFCRLLKDSGCAMLKIGLESGDQRVLDALQKGIDSDMAGHVLNNLKRAGIATYVYLLFGTPPETEKEARRTLDFTVRHSGDIGFLNLAIFNMPAYGPDAAEYETNDFYEGDLGLYRQFSHPGGWHRHMVRQFLEKEFKRHPAVARIIQRDPPLFTSNHAPFFCI